MLRIDNLSNGAGAVNIPAPGYLIHLNATAAVIEKVKAGWLEIKKQKGKQTWYAGADEFRQGGTII